jgi:Fe-S-cluster containining protein
MPGNLCEHCTGMCCRYIALPIDTPETREDFDDIRWYILHEGVSIFVEDGDWYIYLAADCRHLQPDYRCGIYATRPRICREYTTDNCDYHSGEYGWEHHFVYPEHLDEYVRDLLANKSHRAAPVKKSGRRRPRIKARLHGQPLRRPNYATARSDARGTPLPILKVPR